MPNSSEVFRGRAFADLAAEQIQKLSSDIASCSDEYLIRVNSSELAQHKAAQYSLKPLVIKFDLTRVSIEKAGPPQPSFRPGIIEPEGIQTCHARYHLPFDGDVRLLHCAPDPRSPFSLPLNVVDDCLCFDVITSSASESQTVNTEAEAIMQSIMEQYRSLARQVEAYNVKLYATALSEIERRLVQGA